MDLAKCPHCTSPVSRPGEVCPACVELLADLGDDVEPAPQRAPQPAPRPKWPFHPTPQEEREYVAMRLRGAFRPDPLAGMKLPPRAASVGRPVRRRRPSR